MNIINDKKRVNHIKQYGPTCGIYCLTMIIQTLYPMFKGERKGQELAAKLHSIALKNEFSKIGEFFQVSNFINFISLVNKEIQNVSLTTEVISFENQKDLQTQLQLHLKESNSYLIYPALSLKHRRAYLKQLQHIAHWYILDYIEGNIVTGINSCYLKRHSNLKITSNYLYKLNKKLNCNFNWQKYYSKNWSYFNFIKFRRKKAKNKTVTILNNIESAVIKQRKLLKTNRTEQMIRYDLSYKMILIRKQE
ncbi:hypothetical protein [Heyndrickxia sporothermodurans]|uniref:hypothetical protein n=1 Tax=Heyndrickxia sporothermodurans TaxID=46224 RepID=UPI000D33682B|nr:hypothetical protein [Heyndrickxia sporothermodurans]MBL5769019.1 hypothetical protein [Heyndrickxia sporothermodurans]MBL5772806.1 hypothetical protein [Heyndrickxia sporothermodurans]MBL5783372.1 hypothetical protein [Heyndrickxia sporothermodurans]MBL5786894.1 hypothetical protein [Heyndrickxia sporothermodurans]MBL5790511.1 hypothetical protein [Heyndrickxia sporothermodurans]